MTIHFASARNAAASPFARVLIQRRELSAANDNVGFARHQPLIEEALRHFARHGLGAAAEARRQAEEAFFSGDRPGYERWLGICRTIDRRVAARVVRQVERD